MSAGVAINLTWCVPGRVGGSEDYLVRQVLGLVETDPTWAPTLYVPKGFVAAHPELAHVATVEAPFDGHRRARRIVGEHTWLARQTVGASLVHHGGGTVPHRGTRPAVLTLHDLQYRTFPHHFSRIKRRYFDAVLPRSLARAAVVAVPSAYVRDTVIAGFDVVDADRVVVVPHGVEPALGESMTSEADLRERFALGGGPVLVFPAITHPHKGHRFLVELMDRSWHDDDLRLVLIGGAGTAEAEVQAAIAALARPERALRLGRVSAADRSGLVAMSAAVVFPSEYEGFGAPLVEAMALGAPVVSSDRAALPEVAGDAGIVLPLDPDAWADVPQRVARDRRALVEAGRRRALDFTSARSGEALAAAYRMALS